MLLPDDTRSASRRVNFSILLGLLAVLVTLGMGGKPERLPPIVFVSRNPVPGEPDAIPGLGPHHRAVVTGGHMLVREPDGRLRELLPPGAFFDVSDPSVSPSASRIAFAGVTHPDSAWRIWVVGTDGSDLRQVTFDHDIPDPLTKSRSGGIVFFPRSYDLDPCWTNDGTLVFASTRYPQRAQYADVPVTNLFRTCVGYAGGGWCPPRRITGERNGAEEPTMDWKTGQVVFSRWWFNRYLAADNADAITTDAAAAIPRDTVNLWQTMEMGTSHRPRLAAADLRTRRGSMGYQPAILTDGSIAAVYAANLGLSPRPGGTGIHRLTRSFGNERRLAGAIVSGRAGDAYAGTQGLAPPSACSPAGLPDGRVLFSYGPGGRGDFGLYLMNADGSRITRVVDLPVTLELDSAPIVRRAPPPHEPSLPPEEFADVEKARSETASGRPSSTSSPVPETPPVVRVRTAPVFRFHDLDVFADGPPGSPTRGAAPRTPGARIRFFATLARPEREGGDTAILVREAKVGANGEVNERDLPDDTPMFEQLVDSTGRVLMTVHGPAHVAGSNSGRAPYATRCVGCHLGHSTLSVDKIARSRANAAKGARP